VAAAGAVSVITGAGGHVGAACARRFADRRLVLCDADENALEQAAKALEAGANVTTFVGDLTDPAQTTALAAHAAAQGPFGALVHCAGVAPPTAAMPTYDANIVGTMNVLDAFTPLVTVGSVAVCIASIAGHRRFAHVFDPYLLAQDLPGLLHAVRQVHGIDPSRLAYAVSKRAVILQCARRAPEWGPRGGRLVSISPGSLSDTVMGAARQSGSAHGIAEPIGRRVRIEDVVDAVAFAAQTEFLTGSDIIVDGGFLAAVNHELPEAQRERWHGILI